MSSRIQQVRLDKSAGPFRRALQYAFYDWTREMPKSKRIITWVGILIQGYAVYAGLTRSLIWPWMWPKGLLLYLIVWLLYLFGSSVMNGMLTSEFVRTPSRDTGRAAGLRGTDVL